MTAAQRADDPATGHDGILNDTGEWQSGELEYANHQLVGWMGRKSVRQARKP